MFGYVLKVSFLCCIVAAIAAGANDNQLATNFFAVEFIGLVILYFFYLIWKMIRSIIFRFTYDVKYWDGPTITFEGNDRKFLPIIGTVGVWSDSRRRKYFDTFSDEDRKMYISTYKKEVDEWNEAQRSQVDYSYDYEPAPVSSGRSEPRKPMFQPQKRGFRVMRVVNGRLCKMQNCASLNMAIQMAEQGARNNRNTAYAVVDEETGATMWSSR